MLASVGTMEELMISLSQQARIYLAELPRQVRGEVDLMRFDMLSPESVASMQGDLHVSATAADRIASTAEGISALVPDERRAAIADVRRELGGSMDAVRGERAVVVDNLRHIVDVVLLRVAIFLIAAVLLAPLIAHAYARVWPRRLR